MKVVFTKDNFHINLSKKIYMKVVFTKDDFHINLSKKLSLKCRFRFKKGNKYRLDKSSQSLDNKWFIYQGENVPNV
jgi:hypothetical protein